MTKLSQLIGEIVEKTSAEIESLEKARLLNVNDSPNISTDLGVALQKTAELLKRAADSDITYSDVTEFINRVRNV